MLYNANPLSYFSRREIEGQELCSHGGARTSSLEN
jgi:hypothetical protein